MKRILLGAMSDQGVMSVELSPVLEELPRLVAAVESFAETHAIKPGDAMALTLAAEELFTNTVRHGETTTPVHVTLEREPEIATLTYTDGGKAFDTTGSPNPGDIQADVPVTERAVGGLGLHMIRSTMEQFHYLREADRNVTTITRRLGAPKLAR